jgi:hypothetical protein
LGNDAKVLEAMFVIDQPSPQPLRTSSNRQWVDMMDQQKVNILSTKRIATVEFIISYAVIHKKNTLFFLS